MTPRIYDAHLHLQEPELQDLRAEVRAVWTKHGVAGAVVNGTCESDWPEVRSLAASDSRVLPSFGLHPWYIRNRTSNWIRTLEEYLDPGRSFVGEIGIDHHVADRDDEEQESVFLAQLDLAARRNRPATIHCVHAWGRLNTLLRENRNSIPPRGFLLHAYGGSAEMVAGFADLGARFSVSGRVGHPRADRLRRAAKAIPRDRLLIETDAPALPPPPEWTEIELKDPKSGRRLSHPANILSAYRCVARLLDQPVEDLAVQIEQNFVSLFGSCASP